MLKHWWIALSIVATLGLAPEASGQAIPRGSEFQVNVYTPAYQGIPVVAAAPDGDFIVLWKSLQDGSTFDVFARLYSSAGAPLTGEFQINTYTGGYQGFPWAAVEANGDFVVAWESEQDGSGRAVFARLFTSAGAALGAEFQVNTFTAGNQYRPSVATDTDGDFVVAWESINGDGSGEGVFGRRFSSTGIALTPEFQVNTYTPSDQRVPSVAASAAGDFVVAWQSYSQDGAGLGVFGQRFSSAGGAVAAEFQVNAFTAYQQQYASIAAEPNGDFIVGWYSEAQDGSGIGVFARRFSSAGSPLASELQINTYTTGNQLVTSVDADADGDFVVAWASPRDTGATGIFARRFSSAGAAIGSEFQVNTYTQSDQNFPSVALDAEGDFVIAWQSRDQDGDGYGVFVQRFATTGILDIDGNGATQPLTDGLLLVRRFFGFTGATLTNGAVDVGGCTRCDAAAIQTYIAALGLTLDIDGNGSTGALTDGLLALRFLFGFTGTTLTNSAVGFGCSRCDATTIEPYLAELD